MNTVLLKCLPTCFTVFRIIITPVIIWLLMHTNTADTGIYAVFFFTCAALSDLLDGYVARRYNVVSRFGIFLDPIADKILVLGLFGFFWLQGLLSWWVYSIVVGRDCLVTFLRVRYPDLLLAPSQLGKIKTAFQCMSLYALICMRSVGSRYNLYWITHILVGIATMLVVLSGYQYVVALVRLKFRGHTSS